MPARDSKSLLAEVFRQLLFHRDCDIKWHWVEDFVEFGQQANAMLFYNAGGFNSALVVGETFVRAQAGHAYVDAWFRGIALTFLGSQFA